MENTENLENSNNSNSIDKNKAIFDEMANAVKNFNPKLQEMEQQRRSNLIAMIIFYPLTILGVVLYFDYPTKINFDETTTHKVEKVEIEPYIPKFSRTPYHNSNACFIYFHTSNKTIERVSNSDCTLDTMLRYYDAREVKIYKTKIFRTPILYEMKNKDNQILFKITSELEAAKGKYFFAIPVILSCLFMAVSFHFDFINLNRKIKHSQLIQV